MVATLPGDLMANVQRLVEVELKLETGLAAIPHQAAAARTAVGWDPVLKPGHAIVRPVQKNQVSGITITRMKILCAI